MVEEESWGMLGEVVVVQGMLGVVVVDMLELEEVGTVGVGGIVVQVGLHIPVRALLLPQLLA